MDDVDGGRSGTSDVEELILRTIATHADSLLRTARRHSMCVDDAQDAYQRGMEIFLRHADRLDPGRAAAWLHTVVKREAKALRRSRQKLVASNEVDLDSHEALRLPTEEERLLSFDLINRSAEALQRLKPQELRALWLKAQGHSYNDIGAITGWSYTKVNRCLAEGRQSFLERYADIESGDECQRWIPVMSAIVDGEATAAQIHQLRPHLRNCPGCRGRLKALRDSAKPLAALFPIPLAVAAAAPHEPVSNLFVRAYEVLASDIHERAATSITKVQAVLEASSAGKVTAVAASAAAVAGGGFATVDRASRLSPIPVSSRAHIHRTGHRQADPSRMRTPAPVRPAIQPRSSAAHPDRARNEFGATPAAAAAKKAVAEFASPDPAATAASQPPPRSSVDGRAPGSGAGAPEFSRRVVRTEFAH